MASATRLRVRRKVFELGLLPLAPLLPRLDSPAALQSFQRRLLAHSVPAGSPPERRLVTLSALCDALGVTDTVAQVLVDVLDTVAPAGTGISSTGSSAAGGGSPDAGGVDAHHVLLLLFVNTFSRPHVQSAIRNAGDVWPAGEGGGAAVPAAAPGGVHAPLPALQVATSATKAGVSPTKTARRGGGPHALGLAGAAAEDEVLQHGFVVRHLSTILPLLRSTPAAGTVGPDVQLSAAEFDRIGFLFSLVDHPPGTRLSEVAPAFAGGVQKSIALGAARDWLTRSCLPPGPTQRPMHTGKGPAPGGGNNGQAQPQMLVPGDARVEGCQRATLLLRDTDVSGTGAIRLWDCSEAVIYCLAPCAVTSLSNCTDCTVVVGACAAALRLEHCERCTVVAAAGHVQLRSCHGCSLHVFTPRPVLVLGDTRHCRVGPHNTWYDALGAHLARAGLPVGAAASANRCFEAFTLHPPAHMNLPAAGGEALSAAAAGKSAAATAQAGASPDAAAPSGRGTPVPGVVAITACGVTSLPPEEYAPLVVPFSVCSREGQAETAPTSTGGAAPGSPFSLPPGYVAALEARLRRVADVQGAVRDAQLDEAKRKELQAAIQGHFREWLVVTGNMRQVVDLSRVATGGHGASL